MFSQQFSHRPRERRRERETESSSKKTTEKRGASKSKAESAEGRSGTSSASARPALACAPVSIPSITLHPPTRPPCSAPGCDGLCPACCPTRTTPHSGGGSSFRTTPHFGGGASLGEAGMMMDETIVNTPPGFYDCMSLAGSVRVDKAGQQARENATDEHGLNPTNWGDNEPHLQEAIEASYELGCGPCASRRTFASQPTSPTSPTWRSIASRGRSAERRSNLWEQEEDDG